MIDDAYIKFNRQQFLKDFKKFKKYPIRKVSYCVFTEDGKILITNSRKKAEDYAKRWKTIVGATIMGGKVKHEKRYKKYFYIEESIGSFLIARYGDN